MRHVLWPSGRRIIGILSGLVLCLPVAQGSEIYIYRDRDGVTLFTDRRDMGPDYTFIRRNGRPTASQVCQGLTRAAMDQRAMTYMPVIRHHANHHGVDEAMIKAIIMVESCFDPQAVSRVGAEGLMQLMPGTARELGVENAFDPAENIRGGVTYFARMLERFDHDLTLALAAYNAGPGAVERHGGVPPFRETQQYISRVMAQYRVLRPEAGISLTQPTR
ncbi:Transglycosylase SLT domain-containing protein [Ectothiorhodospira magna]|uniref:Transglycosylase SLT domain-containing protein n=1 Tax=Ectothiorhodospira magna TaxID=867345 RepID=A0A1H9GNR8_9GAMM|nr:transglycosylase SLT domain-containing protein [Ectothiorhodospira magna]SEQ51639.1 Transglycosylase SLT domain-containing protein [Ectothiorhodospira magna]